MPRSPESAMRLVELTGWHRDYARAALRDALKIKAVQGWTPRPPTYGPRVIAALATCWAVLCAPGARGVVGRTNSWHNRGFTKLATCTDRRGTVMEAFVALANAIIIRRLQRAARTTRHWDTRPARRP